MQQRKRKTESLKLQMVSSIRAHGDEPVSLFVVHRHSVRAPMCYPPGDGVYLSRNNFPRGPSYLTDVGIKRSLQVGKIWKRWFPQFITGNPREVWARSSEAYRCAETCNTLLYALYSSKSNYQPISVIVPPENQDKYIGSNSLSDEELFRYMENHIDTEVHTKDGKAVTVRNVLDFVKIQMNLEKDTNDYNMFIYLDGLSSLEYNKLAQPPWYTKNRKVIDAAYNILYHQLTVTLRPFYGYYLLKGVADRICLVRDGKAKFGERVNLFSFHDFSVSAVLTALDESFHEFRPHFLSAVFFELYRRPKDDLHYMMVSWSEGLDTNGSYASRKPLPLTWNGGSNRVKLDDFLPRLQDNTYSDYMKKNALLGYTGEDAFV
ncbi:uncharacterized protein LOC111261845 isoform X1 [Varroa jacobsoni]|uniref:uncharacterized protein LOC111261845 isoform X1 n=2 Tax=Varroa jacobsoni TaxID=62625 RepID=UPI000BF256B8|nr:uncharacterized protein LOC111261845 isoform X1 [Varroa jacobsoni]